MNQIGRVRGALSRLLLLGSVSLAGCGGDTHPRVPTTFTKVSDNQTAVVGKAVAIPPTVAILDANGNGIAGIEVTFALASGGGTLTGSTATTNAEGRAAAGSWIMGTTSGFNTLTAAAVNVPGSPVTFNAIATAAAPATITKLSAEPSSPPAGSNVDSIVVRIADQYGNPVGGASVTFAVTGGGGSVSPATVVTGANGLAAARWILGPDAKVANTATATCAGLSTTIGFSLTTGLAVSTVRLAARSFVVDSSATFTPGVSVIDVQGNPIPDAGVTLILRSTSTAMISGATVTGSKPGQTFLVATSVDNTALKDSALLIVANVASPVVTATFPRFDLKTDTTFTVPIVIDMRASGEKVGAATLQLTWDPNVLTYVSDAVGDAVPNSALVINTAAAATGSVTLTFADGTGYAGIVGVRTFTFKVSSVTARTGTLAISASDLVGATTLKNMLPKTVTSFYPVRTR
jgi:hypothetical protein